MAKKLTHNFTHEVANKLIYNTFFKVVFVPLYSFDCLFSTKIPRILKDFDFCFSVILKILLSTVSKAYLRTELMVICDLNSHYSQDYLQTISLILTDGYSIYAHLTKQFFLAYNFE